MYALDTDNSLFYAALFSYKEFMNSIKENYERSKIFT
jgi:hypothetical protein